MGHTAVTETVSISTKPLGRLSSKGSRNTERKPQKVIMGALNAQPTDTFKQHMPRRIRLKLARSTERKQNGVSAEMHVAAQPSSPVAVNAFTGKLAVGPWLGPFEGSEAAADTAEPVSPLYMNQDGTAFFTLEEPDGTYADSGVSSPASAGGMVSILSPDCSNAMRRLQIMQVAAVEHRRPKHASSRVPFQTGSRAKRNMHGLKQPRRGF